MKILTKTGNRCLRIALFLLVFAAALLAGKHSVYAITVDTAEVEASGERPTYHLTKGASYSFSFTLYPQTAERVGPDGTVYYETAYPEIVSVKSTKPSVATYENGRVTGISEGTTAIKITYRYKFSTYTLKDSCVAYVRVVAYSRSGNTFNIDPNLLVNGDITYSLVEASAEVRDLATDEDHYAIHIPAGNYILTDTIHIYSNVTIDMDPNAVITMKGATGTNMFLLGTVSGSYQGVSEYNLSEACAGYGGFSNITIRGGVLVGNDSSTSCIIRMAHATNVTLDGVTLKGGGGAHQMEVAAIDGFTVKNCTFSDFYGKKGVTGNYEALQLDIPVTKVLAESPYPDTYEDGTMMKNVTITGCTFKNLSKGVGTHTTLIGAYHENITITDNKFINITNEAILCLNYYNCTISGNTIKDCGAGIDFSYYLPNRYCIYNTILDGTKVVNYKIRHDAQTVISGNKITVSYQSGQKSDVGCYAVNVYGYNRKETITGAAGNKVKAQNYYISGVNVEDNTITTGGYGIRLQDAKKCSVTGNKIIGKNFSDSDPHAISGYTYDGIYITNASTTTELSRNTIKNMNGGGIYLSASTAIGGIKDNTISGVKRYGIYLYSGAKTKDAISGNLIKSTSEAEALIYINTSSKIRVFIARNTLKGNKTNDAIKIDAGKFTIEDNTILRVANGAVIADGASGCIYANNCSNKAASNILFTDKNFHMASVVQTKAKAKSDGTLTVELPATAKASGYEVMLSGTESFDGDVLLSRHKKDAGLAFIGNLKAKKTYYVRVYGYRMYNGVKIYRNAD